MGLESVTYIDDLNELWPLGTDAKSAGDDHIRRIKAAIKATFPEITGEVEASHTELSFCVGVTSAIQTQLDAKQPLDAELTALAALTGTGLVRRTGDNTFDVVSALAAANGGTGATSLSDAIQGLLDAISTTQGSILYYNGTDWVVLTPGTVNQVLTTQGAAANPIWANASDWTTIEDTTVSGVSSWSNSTIASGGWKDIKLIFSVLVGTNGSSLMCRLNGNGGENDYVNRSTYCDTSVNLWDSTNTHFSLTAGRGLLNSEYCYGEITLPSANLAARHGLFGRSQFHRTDGTGVPAVLGVSTSGFSGAISTLSVLPDSGTMSGRFVLLGRK